MQLQIITITTTLHYATLHQFQYTTTTTKLLYTTLH